MRKLLGVLLLFLLLGSVCAHAEMYVMVNNDRIVLGEWICAEVTDADGAVVYSVYKDDELLFEGLPTTAMEGWYQPAEKGEYVICVTAAGESETAQTARTAFEVCGEPSCTLVVSEGPYMRGQGITFDIAAEGGTGRYTYEVAMISGNACIDRIVSTESTICWVPETAGDVQVLVTVTDDSGHESAAEATLDILEAPGINVTGDTGAFHGAGGMRALEVQSADVWQATTADDFITLHSDCGIGGDKLIFSVSENGTGAAREGRITLQAGNEKQEIQVYQSNHFPLESEVYMAPVTDVIFVDGDVLSAWHFADGERTFRIEASGKWDAVCDQAFVTLQKDEGALHVTLSDNQTDEARDAAVILTCGRAQAVLYITQPSESVGADVKSVRPAAEGGTAYQDEIACMVITSADANALTVSSDMWQQPMVIDRADAVLYQEKELLWHVMLPLTGEGETTVLFTAENDAGAGMRKTALLHVTAAESAFAGGAALYEKDGIRYADVKVTRGTQFIRMEDKDGKGIALIDAESAFVDHAPDGDLHSRYVLWTLEVPAEAADGRLVIGEQVIDLPQAAKAAKGEPGIYSQQDTTWADVRYRQSNLEHSGCAIFALSHALERLGFEGEEILPANLAQKYAFCLVEGGTLNSTLVGNAGRDLGFKTRFDLYKSLPEIVDRTRQGVMWSFMVAPGHIAAVVGMNEDGTMFRVVDSAPSATFERTEVGTMYMMTKDGQYVPITDLGDVPGSRYYIETGGYNGMEYYMTGAYIAKQGVRLIMPVAAE